MFTDYNRIYEIQFNVIELYFIYENLRFSSCMQCPYFKQCSNYRALTSDEQNLRASLPSAGILEEQKKRMGCRREGRYAVTSLVWEGECNYVREEIE